MSVKRFASSDSERGDFDKVYMFDPFRLPPLGKKNISLQRNLLKLNYRTALAIAGAVLLFYIFVGKPIYINMI